MSDWGDKFPGMKLKERYQQDNNFRLLVDTIRSCIDKGQYTPTEIREAAMLAQIMYEEWHPRPLIFTLDDVIKGRV